jgi:site-specific recombinase XerD
MEEHSVRFYEPMVGKEFIENILSTCSYAELSQSKKDIIRSVNVLTEYQAAGTVKFRSVLKTHELKGEIGEFILGFLSYRMSNGLAKDTLDCNRLYLHRFLDHLAARDVRTVSCIEKHHILDFINSLAFYSKATMHCMLSCLRNFLKYLRDKQYTVIDFSYLVPKSSYKKEARLPTTYEKDEVERLIQAVDRGNPKGKRDIAMILLAARLGLRASDICGLKFENIHWETNAICLTQQKTKEKIELPLLEEIGTAIIDYLKYGRPTSKLPYIFTHLNQPYDRLAEPTLHSIVCLYLRRARISNVDEKKHGPHALRHSLAGFLLKKKTPLPVISEVLGHANTESTKTYLRIDLEALRLCALEVPPSASPCYHEVA